MAHGLEAPGETATEAARLDGREWGSVGKQRGALRAQPCQHPEAWVEMARRMRHPWLAPTRLAAKDGRASKAR